MIPCTLYIIIQATKSANPVELPMTSPGTQSRRTNPRALLSDTSWRPRPLAIPRWTLQYPLFFLDLKSLVNSNGVWSRKSIWVQKINCWSTKWKLNLNFKIPENPIDVSCWICWSRQTLQILTRKDLQPFKKNIVESVKWLSANYFTGSLPA